MMKHLSLVLLTTLVTCSPAFSQYIFEGKAKQISEFNKKGIVSANIKDLWYLPGEGDYQEREETQFDSCNIAYFRDSLSLVMNEETRAILKLTGVINGFYHGVYFTKHKEGRREVQENKDTYIAYLGLDLDRFNVWVNYVSLNRQYVMNYEIDHRDELLAFIRLLTNDMSGTYSISITAEMQGNALVINTHFNRQDLKLTITPRETRLDAIKRKMGMKKEPLTVFLPRETKSLEDMTKDEDTKQ